MIFFVVVLNLSCCSVLSVVKDICNYCHNADDHCGADSEAVLCRLWQRYPINVHLQGAVIVTSSVYV